jgi:hypothetical protein
MVAFSFGKQCCIGLRKHTQFAHLLRRVAIYIRHPILVTLALESCPCAVPTFRHFRILNIIGIFGTTFAAMWVSVLCCLVCCADHMMLLDMRREVNKQI